MHSMPYVYVGCSMLMSKRLTSKKVAKWVGLTISAIVLVVWLASRWTGLGYLGNSWLIRMGRGSVSCHYLEPETPFTRRRGWFRLNFGNLSWSAFKDEVGRLLFNRLPKDHFTTHPESVRRDAWRRQARQFGFIAPNFVSRDVFGGLRTVTLTIPMWMIFLLVLAPTALFWWKDRRRPPGRCRCGYLLTGNITGICPECGVAISDDTKKQLNTAKIGQ